jgi:HD-GYP domain-containing protein (c-di-GMP phosphodiesterase class II)
VLHTSFAASSPLLITKAELVGAFSYALDLTEGQPAGHCLRACWIGMQIGRELGLDAAERSDLYFAILLKDLGCSSNAARICELYDADDRAFKQGFKTVGTSLAATLHFVFARTARGSSVARRVGALGNILKNGDAIAQELIVSRCTRGSDIARSLRFSDAVCEAIYRLDEHWDGSGRPGRLSREQIPLFARIALLAQIADVFHAHAGPAAATDEIVRRSGAWLDPALVAAFQKVAARPGFWETLASPAIATHLMTLVPADHSVAVDDTYLDAIAVAFGDVIDAKSPFTSGHSARVARFADACADHFGFTPGRKKSLHRAALLHDVGKLGVSNTILDKPGPLDQEEWKLMRAHALETGNILGRINAFADIAALAAAHHERLDGTGYPGRLAAADITLETRIITACDYYDALTANRPYRAAMSNDAALAIMQAEEGTAIDAECLAALRIIVASGGSQALR